jgi:glycolate oxidase iron-sulfur subunit
MQTHFSLQQLADPHTSSLEKILRSCVHCGFCTATCPTYVVGGDERDSPRGRIYLIKELMETGRAPNKEDVWPIDHCLSCLACMTTCPSGVDYRRLVDHTRAVIETEYERPQADRLLRAALAWMLPYRGRFRAALALAMIGRPFAPILARLPVVGPQLAAMLALAPKALAARVETEGPGEFKAPGAAAIRRRVALLTGCAQGVLAPEINAATIRLLNRAGVDVVLARGETCCGSLLHHMGREAAALDQARANVDAWTREIDNGGLEAIVITASGCGSTIKDYGFMLADDPAYAKKAEKVAALAKDATEYIASLDLDFALPQKLVVAYHAACSLQHGQKITEAPKALLRRAGFDIRTPAESHLCCGSAGTYNILQPEVAGKLRSRKVANIARLKPDVIAAGNIGCLTQIGSGTTIPIVHTVELLDWAHGGPKPAAIARGNGGR